MLARGRGAYYLAELKKIRPVSDMKDRPLTAEEQGRIDAAVEAKMRADRAAFVDEYHIDYIDPVTGEWKGGAGALGSPDVPLGFRG
jgi:gentisate 1,2-dioxygenase